MLGLLCLEEFVVSRVRASDHLSRSTTQPIAAAPLCFQPTWPAGTKLEFSAKGNSSKTRVQDSTFSNYQQGDHQNFWNEK